MPAVSFGVDCLEWVHCNVRLHLANHVRTTCTLFEHVPQSERWARAAKVCSIAGSEEFYSVAIPVMTWCVLSFSLSRALVLLLAANLYVGNSLKNVFCLPRPPLVHRVGGKGADEENKVGGRRIHVDALGFGWPSTHSCNAVSLPFAALRIAYGSALPSLPSSFSDLAPPSAVAAYLAYLLAALYATAVPLSRLVLGVHSPTDVSAGVLYGLVHLRLWLHHHQSIGEHFDSASVPVMVAGFLLLAALHPRVNPQNYTYEESVCILAYALGFLLGERLAGWHGGLSVLRDASATGYACAARVGVGYGVVLPAKEVIKAATAFIRTPQFLNDKGEKEIERYCFGFGDFVSRTLQYGVGYGVGCTYFAPGERKGVRGERGEGEEKEEKRKTKRRRKKKTEGGKRRRRTLMRRPRARRQTHSSLLPAAMSAKRTRKKRRTPLFATLFRTTASLTPLFFFTV